MGFHKHFATRGKYIAHQCCQLGNGSASRY
jgi:hypothetical protein